MGKKWSVSLLVVVLLFACSKQEAVQEEAAVEPVELSPLVQQEAGAFVPGIANVLVTEEFSQLIESDLEAGSLQTKSGSLNSALDGLHVLSMRRLFPDEGKYEERTRREGLHRWYRVEYDASQSLTKAEHTFFNVSGVEYVEGVHKIKSLSVFDDPLLPKQWGFINTSNKGVDINVEKVWTNYTTGNPKVIVAVMDTGMDLNHEDLVGNVLPGGPGGSKNFVTGGYVIDAEDHGTHVAGTIAAVNNNGIGVCGTAGGNAATGEGGVKIMSCQILGGNSDTPGAYKWAADNGAVISSNSWGYVLDVNDNGVIDADELARAKDLNIEGADKAAVDYFVKYAGCDNNGNQLPDSPMKGGVVIFAAGNDGIMYGAPANYEAVIAVGAVSSDGKRADFSNYGDWVDIAAPGVAIRSTVPGNDYDGKSGTSMACPHVSGVAALVVSYYGGPGFTADMLKERLLKGANGDMLPSNSRIGPMVDALGAMTYGSSDTPEKVASYEVKPVSNSLEFTWKVTGNSLGLPATGYVLFASKKHLTSLNPAKPGEDVYLSVVEVGELEVGDQMTARIEDLEFDTSYYVTLAGYDYGRNFSAIAEEKTATTLKNNPPVITTTYTGNYKVHAHETLTIPYVISDPDGHALKIDFTKGSEAETWMQGASEGAYNLSIKGNDATPGNYTATIKATDSYGLSTSLSISYTILENQAPVVVKSLDNMIFHSVGEKFTLDMSEYFEDPDGETLRYSIDISNKTVLNLNQQVNTLYGTTLSFGLTQITLTGADAKGLTVSQSFLVLVRNADTECQTYPNPVTDYLHVSNGEMTEISMHVVIVSATGQTVYDNTVSASAFSPASIDISGFAPGRYSVTVSYNGKEFKYTIIKK